MITTTNNTLDFRNNPDDEFDPCRWMKQSPWQRYWILRKFRRLLMTFGFFYVSSAIDPHKFWQVAIRHVPFKFRFMGWTLTMEQLDSELADNKQWNDVKVHYRSGDKIWPFIVNPDTSAMRLGYIFIRDRRPVAGIITMIS